jgi:hypothetical protein
MRPSCDQCFRFYRQLVDIQSDIDMLIHDIPSLTRYSGLWANAWDQLRKAEIELDQARRLYLHHRESDTKHVEVAA